MGERARRAQLENTLPISAVSEHFDERDDNVWQNRPNGIVVAADHASSDVKHLQRLCEGVEIEYRAFARELCEVFHVLCELCALKLVK